MVEFHRRLVKALKAEGVPMVAGTDAMTSGVVGGFSLHEELELLVGAGMTNEEALASATRLPQFGWVSMAIEARSRPVSVLILFCLMPIRWRTFPTSVKSLVFL